MPPKQSLLKFEFASLRRNVNLEVNEKHIKYLIFCVREIRDSVENQKGVWLGKSTKKWLQSAKNGYNGDWRKDIGLDPNVFEDRPYYRDELKDLIHKGKSNFGAINNSFVRWCIANIFAWGGQGTRYARASQQIGNWDNWKKPCFQL